MQSIGVFNCKKLSTLDGFDGPGAEFMPEYAEYSHDDGPGITSPRKNHGPEANDLVRPLREPGIEKVILAGTSANNDLGVVPILSVVRSSKTLRNPGSAGRVV